MKVLILALSGIGDALMFTPALTLLRQAHPEAQIDALVMFKGVKGMYERNPKIDNVYYFDFMSEGQFRSFRYLLGLRNKYDASINVYPSNRKEYNIINFLIGAKKRAGVRYLRVNGKELGFLNNVTVTENDSLHNVVENIRLVEKLLDIKFEDEPALEFALNGDDIKSAEEFFNRIKLTGGDIVVGFHPGSATLKNHINRRWEPEKFIALGRKLISELNARVFVFGGPEEDELKQRIAGGINLPGAVKIETKNLSESAAIIKRCNVFVSNDSSLMHVAAAMQRKVVAIIGPTNTNYIHPWKTEHKIVSLNLDCSPCFIYSPCPLICFRDDVKFKCIKELDVDMVYNAVNSFI